MSYYSHLRNVYHSIRCLRQFEFPSLCKLIAANFSKQTYCLHPKGSGSPLFIRGGTTDGRLVASILGYQQYGFPEISGVNFIIDAGANIGISARWFLEKFPQSRLIAIEPESTNFAVMKQNLAGQPNAQCLRAAVWGSQTALAIEDETMAKYAFSCKEVTEDATGKIDSVTLNQLVGEAPKDSKILVKMDIEGAEKNVFEASDLSWVDKIDYLVLEIHPGCWKSVFQAMNRFDYDCRFRGENILFLLKH